MGEIYARSECTVVWLGERDEAAQSDLGMQLFPILVKVARYEVERVRASRDAGVNASATSTNTNKNTDTNSDVPQYRLLTPTFSEWYDLGQPITSLFNRDWFGRVWTLQEVALSQKAEVYCGKYSFPFSLIEEFERGCNTDTTGTWGAALESIGWREGLILKAMQQRERKRDRDRDRRGGEDGDGHGDEEGGETGDRNMLAHAYTVATLKSGKLSTARVLHSLRSLDCSEHQDRVFSVLRFLDSSLAEEAVKMPGRTIEELYRVVAVYVLGGGDLRCLGAAGRSQQRVGYRGQGRGQGQGHVGEEDVDINISAGSSRPYLDLPSWVPDWTFLCRSTPYWVINEDCIVKTGTPLYSAGGPGSDPNENQEPTVQFISNPPILRLHAIQIGTITHLTPPFHRPDLPENVDDPSKNLGVAKDAIEYYRLYIESATTLAATHCTPGRYTPTTSLTAVRSTLTAGLTSPTKRTSQSGTLIPANPQQIDDMFVAFNRYVTLAAEQTWALTRLTTAASEPLTVEDMTRMQRLTLAAQSATADAAVQRSLFAAMAEMCSGRCFFVTDADSQRMGMAPDIARVGDLVVVVPGTCTPFVVRAVGDYWEVVGEGYVHGIMDGEVLREEGMVVETLDFV